MKRARWLTLIDSAGFASRLHAEKAATDLENGLLSRSRLGRAGEQFAEAAGSARVYRFPKQPDRNPLDAA